MVPGSTRSPSKSEEPTRGRKRGSQATEPVNPSSTSSVFIYSRANFARPPVAQLPGHKKASLAVKFSSVLYELRPGVFGPDVQTDTKMITVERGKEDNVTVDIGTTPSATPMTTPSHTAISLVESISPLPSPLKHSSALLAPLAVPAPTGTSGLLHTLPSPAPSASDSVSVRPFSPAVSKPPTPAPGTGSVFSLPYRMLYAVATTDTVTIYDTQQSGPVCILTNLHYREFTDMTWYAFPLFPCRDCVLIVFWLQVARRSMPHAFCTRRLLHNRRVRRDLACSPHSTTNPPVPIYRPAPLRPSYLLSFPHSGHYAICLCRFPTAISFACDLRNTFIEEE